MNETEIRDRIAVWCHTTELPLRFPCKLLWDKGTSERPHITVELNNVVYEIQKGSLGVIQPRDCAWSISVATAKRITESEEFKCYVAGSEWNMRQLKEPEHLNNAFGFLSHLYGYEFFLIDCGFTIYYYPEYDEEKTLELLRAASKDRNSVIVWPCDKASGIERIEGEPLGNNAICRLMKDIGPLKAGTVLAVIEGVVELETNEFVPFSSVADLTKQWRWEGPKPTDATFVGCDKTETRIGEDTKPDQMARVDVMDYQHQGMVETARQHLIRARTMLEEVQEKLPANDKQKLLIQRAAQAAKIALGWTEDAQKAEG